MTTTEKLEHARAVQEAIERKLQVYTELRLCYGIYLVLTSIFCSVLTALVCAHLKFPEPLSAGFWLVCTTAGVLGGGLFYWGYMRNRLREERAYLNDEVFRDLSDLSYDTRPYFGLRSARIRYAHLIDPALERIEKMEQFEYMDSPSEHVH